MRKYLICFVVAMLIVQTILPGGARVSASDEQAYVLVNEVGNGTEQMSAGADLTKANQIALWDVLDLVVDASGNLYFTVSYTGLHVFKVTPAGDLSTFAGIGQFRTNPSVTDEQNNPKVGDKSNEVRMSRPKSLAIDSQNNMYIAEEKSGKVFKVDIQTNEILDIYQLASWNQGDNVVNIALDSADNLYVYYANGTQELSQTFKLGKLYTNQSDVKYKQFEPITDITLETGDNRFVNFEIDREDNLYFLRVGSNSSVHKYTVSTKVLAPFVSRTGGFDFQHPRFIVFDKDNNGYFTTSGGSSMAGNYGNQIIKVTQTGVRSMVAGAVNMQYGFSEEGSDPKTSRINGPKAIAIHPENGTIYYYEHFSNLIRSIQPAYHIEYVGNGHTDGTVAGSQQVWGNKPATLATQGDMLKTGHQFLNWNTAEDGSGTNYAAGTSVTPASNLKLYAIWEPETYDLVYQASTNGTLSNSSMVNQAEIRYDNVVYNTAIDAVTAVPSAGYAFAGWSDGQQAVTRQDTANANLDVTASFLKQHTVTFDTYGGTAISPQLVLDGRLLTLPAPPINDDLDFDGWYTDMQRTIRFDETTTPITSDLTLYASWETKYTVSLYPNNEQAVSSLPVTEATYLSKPADPIRIGHTFAGWYTDDVSFMQLFNFTDTPIMSDLSLYAKWRINNYSVTFNTNGGTAVASKTVPYDTQVDAVTTTRAGHTLVGWYKDAAFSEVFNFSSDVITGEIQLYAKWEINDYTVAFNTNGGTAVASQTVEYQSKLDAVTTTRVGYTFAGWYEDAGLTQVFDLAQTAITGDTQLYAKWGAIGYTVTFNTNGGTAVASQTVPYDTRVDAVTTSRAGHTLVGWYKDAAFSEAFNFSSDVITGAIQLHAKWKINDYSVTFNTNGGTAVASQTVEYQSKLDAVTTTRVGYTFAGWYEDSGLTQAFNLAQTAITGDTQLYAKWEAIGYTVTFNTNGGTAVASKTVPYDTQVDAVTTSRAGHTLVGWYKNAEFSEAFNFASDVITDAIQLYAKWEINDYTVTFNTNGGTAVGSQTVEYQSKLEAVTTTRVGYTFAGWYADAGLTQAFDLEQTAITGDTQLYAKWEAIGYTVTFNTNGGTAVASKTVLYDTRVDAVTTSRAGHTLVGWYKDAGLTQAFDLVQTAVTGDMKLHAKWVLTPPGAPTILSTTTGNAKVNLEWSGVPFASRYSVYQGTTAGALGKQVATVNDAVNHYEVTGLTNGVTYYFVVSAWNEGGESKSIEVGATPLTLATAPRSVAAVAGDSSATLTFTAPEHNGGSAITGYRITSTPDNVVVNTTSTTVNITGLTNGTAYTFTVEARNQLGYGTVSGPSNEVTPTAPYSGGTTGGYIPGGGTTTVKPNIPVDGEITLPAGTAGEVKLGEGISVTVPAGASKQELRLTIEEIAQIEGLDRGGEVFASPIYELLKNFSDHLDKPVTLTLKFDTTKVQEGQHVAIFYYNEDDNAWIEVGGTISGDSIEAEVDYAAKFSVLVVADQVAEELITVYSDIAGHWAERKIVEAMQLGIVSGYEDDTFRPGALISRAEFSVMLANALKLDLQDAPSRFVDDENIAEWARQAVSQAVEAGIISGYSDNSFRPNASITRAELASMIARAYSTEAITTETSEFADESEIPQWAKGAVSLVKSLGIVNGKADNRFAPQDTATRAEAVTMIMNLLQVLK